MEKRPPESPCRCGPPGPGEGCTKPDCKCQPREGVNQIVQISSTLQVSSTMPPTFADSQGFSAGQGFFNQPGKIITELNFSI